jgi:hypothetical protein
MRAKICAKPSSHERDNFVSKTYQSATIVTKSLTVRSGRAFNNLAEVRVGLRSNQLLNAFVDT